MNTKNIILVQNNYIDIDLIETISTYEVTNEKKLYYFHNLDSVAYEFKFDIGLMTRQELVEIKYLVTYNDIFYNEKDFISTISEKHNAFDKAITDGEIRKYFNDEFRNIKLDVGFKTPRIVHNKYQEFIINNSLTNLLNNDLKLVYYDHFDKIKNEYDQLIQYWSKNKTNKFKTFFMK